MYIAGEIRGIHDLWNDLFLNGSLSKLPHIILAIGMSK
jgi:hypothetical protein